MVRKLYSNEEVIQTDILVIGAGMGGCRAALRAKELGMDVTLVDKGIPGRSGASPFIHCMLAPVPDGAQESWLREIVKQSEYLADQEWMEIIFEELGKRVQELRNWGVHFETDEKGNLKYFSGRGHIISKALNLNGLKMMDTMRALLSEKQIRVVTRVMVTDLLTSDGVLPTSGRIAGAIGFHTQKGNPVVFQSKVVILATGPLTTKSLVSTYIDNLTGDGEAMAFRAGASLTNMEFATQASFNYVENRFKLLGQGKFQGLGARLINRSGERIMEKYDPANKEQSTNAIICLAMVKEVMEGKGPIYLDMRHFTDEEIATLWRILPEAMESFNKAGMNIRERPVEIKPVPCLEGGHSASGIKIGFACETRVPGLYAAGYVARLPEGVANWSALPQAYANVSGYRAGENAALKCMDMISAKVNPQQLDRLREGNYAPLDREKGIKPEEIFHSLNRIVNPAQHFFFKNEERINRVLTEIRRLKDKELPLVSADSPHQLTQANEARNVVLLAEIIFLCALHRKESRGPHYRQDYPFKNDKNWLKWLNIRSTKKEITIEEEPVPFERYKIKPEVKEVLLHPVQIKAEKVDPPPLEISQGVCNGCKLCIDSCPMDVIRMNDQNKAYPTYVDDCTACTLCEKDCPVNAIRVSAGRKIPADLLPYQ